MMKLDLLAFGAHPDDVELSCAGVLALEKKRGRTTGIIDLTRGELGTRGTAETREQEAADSAKILGVDVRENLDMADGFFDNDRAHQLQVIRVLRKYRPEIVLCNAPEDRHPDHGRAAKLVAESCFLSGLSKIKTEVDGKDQESWRPKYVLNYIQDRYLKPDFVVDVTEVFDQKLESMKAFKTQFFSEQAPEGPVTYISTPGFLDSVVYRYKMFGKMIGVQYAEGFISVKTVGLHSLDALILENT
jgi:bacillithiol biosynthesis deacetylase BshB1